MAGILNHSIVYIIEKTSDDVKTILSAFFLPIMLQDFSWHDDWNWSMISIYNYEWIQTTAIKKAHIGGVFLIYIQKKKSFYLGLKAWKNLFTEQ